MWLLTTRGFYSIVMHRDDPETMVVRARVCEDLEALRERYLPELQIVDSAGTDYRYRALVAKLDWAVAAHRLAFDVDYPNFKDAVADQQGPARARLYTRIWTTLLELQRGG